MGTVEKGLEVAQKTFVRFSRSRVNKFGVLHPDTGADQGYTVRCHVSKIVFPHRRVAGAGKIPAVFFGGEVVRAYGEIGLSPPSEEITLNAKRVTLVECTELRHPETIFVKFSKLSLLAKGGANFVEACLQRLLKGRCQTRGLLALDRQRDRFKSLVNG